MGLTGAVNMPVANALLLDLAPPERRQSVLALNYTAMSVAYTLGVMPAGYVAEQGYGFLAASAAAGYVLVAASLCALRCAAPCRSSARRRQQMPVRAACATASFLRFAALAFVFPFSMGLVVSASPLFAADAGAGRGLHRPGAGRQQHPRRAARAAGGGAHRGRRARSASSAPRRCSSRPRSPAMPRSRSAAAALLVGTIVFSFGELVFSSAVPAAVARLAPPGRRGAYQGGWALVASFSMGSALFFSGLLRDAVGWRGGLADLRRASRSSPALLLFACAEVLERPRER